MDVLAELAESRGDATTSDALHQMTISALTASGNHGRCAEACLRYSRLLERRDDMAGALRYARLGSKRRSAAKPLG